MTYEGTLRSLGLKNDPFAKTNADDEDHLVQYFIPPPFFSAVYGQPNNPQSCFVFAPRGGGKTALKRRIELSSAGLSFLCVTYNNFDVTGLKTSDVDATYHLSNVVRLVLVGIVTAIHDRGITSLTREQRRIVYLVAKSSLSGISQSDIKSAIASVKSLGQKAKDFWNSMVGPVGFVLNNLLERVGFSKSDIAKFEKDGGQVGSYIEQLIFLREVSRGIGYDSIYVLIDRVDETPITGKASEAFKFIEPLASNLQLLELSGFAFKFFLWDLLFDEYKQISRPDRVKYYRLEWTRSQLEEMLSKRLRAFSEGEVSSFDMMLDEAGRTSSADQAIAMFAQGSPRKMIRICKEIVDRQSELSSRSKSISIEAFVDGIEAVAEAISSEEFKEQHLKDLRRNARLDFTIRHVYSNVFKITQPAGIAKIKNWEEAGAVELIGTINETAGARPSNHYAVSNYLLAKYIMMDMDALDFLGKKIRYCEVERCSSVLVRDWDNSSAESRCHKCQTKLN